MIIFSGLGLQSQQERFSENLSKSIQYTPVFKGFKTSKLPPKAWWNEKVKEIKEGNPDYTEDQVNATAASIWWDLSGAERKERREDEGKKYGDTPASEKVKKANGFLYRAESLNKSISALKLAARGR